MSVPWLRISLVTERVPVRSSFTVVLLTLRGPQDETSKVGIVYFIPTILYVWWGKWQLIWCYVKVALEVLIPRMSSDTGKHTLDQSDPATLPDSSSALPQKYKTCERQSSHTSPQTLSVLTRRRYKPLTPCTLHRRPCGRHGVVTVPGSPE